jgi:hypothetical protein
MDSLIEGMDFPLTLWSKPSEEYIMQSPSPQNRHPQANVREQQQPPQPQPSPQQQRRPVESTSSPSALAQKLEVLHRNIRDAIFDSPPSERGELLSVVANWASCVARSPLEPLPKPLGIDDGGALLEVNNVKGGRSAEEHLMALDETDKIQATAV